MTDFNSQGILQALEQGRVVEFSHQGKDFFIQQENNKGWDYLSIWRDGEPPVCLGRVFFDIFDGISEDTIRELMELPCMDGHALAELSPVLFRRNQQLP